MPTLTSLSIRDALDHIALANHCQAGATIALSGALAAALAQATANGSLEDGASGKSATAAQHMQARMTQVRTRFQHIADEDASAITAFVELRRAGQALKGYELLCDGPQEMAELAIRAAHAMEDYRAFVCDRTKDDLEFAVTLMSGVARAAMQLLDSNLRIWPLPELLAKYDASVGEFEKAIDALTPIQRVRLAAGCSGAPRWLSDA